jgi:hypothetical protein
MSVSQVTEIFPERGGPTGVKDVDVRMFDVVMTSGLDTKYTILKSGLVPLRGHSHHTEAHLTCKNTDTRPNPRANSPRHWLHKCEYDNQPYAPLPQLATAIEVNPLLRKVEIEGRSYIGRQARTLGALIATKTLADWNNGAGTTIPTDLSPLQSTAYEPFEGHEEDDPIWVVDVTLNAATVQDWVRTYQGAINKDAVEITGYSGVFPPRTLMLKDWSHSKRLSEKLPSGVVVDYFATRFGLHYKRRGWITPIRNEGYFKLVSGIQKLITILGARPSAKVLLDANGNVLTNPSASNSLYRFYAELSHTRGKKDIYIIFEQKNPNTSTKSKSSTTQ